MGVLISPYPAESWFRLLPFVAGLMTYLLTVRLVTTPRRFWWALRGLAGLGLVVSLIGLVGTHWTTYRFLPLATVVGPLPRLPDAMLASAGAPDRLHPNQLGGLLAMVVPPLVGTILFGAALRWLLPATLVVVGLYLSLSLARGALLALGVALVLLTAWRSTRLGATIGLLGLGAGLGLLLMTPGEYVRMLLFSDLTEPQWFPIPTRLQIWSDAIGMLRESPWTGIGLGTFSSAFHQRVVVAPFFNTVIAPHAHNLALQAALDLGAVGAVAYLALLTEAGISAFLIGRAIRCGVRAGAAYGLAAGVLAFGLFGLFDTITVTSRAAPLVWFVVGLAAASARALTASIDTPDVHPTVPQSTLRV